MSFVFKKSYCGECRNITKIAKRKEEAKIVNVLTFLSVLLNVLLLIKLSLKF